MRHQLTGNVGLYHVARELSRRGWHVMPTVRNARGADLYAASDDEARVLPIQSKARSEEHTSELQSLMRISYAVLCLKKKKLTNKKYTNNNDTNNKTNT